jgi:hypothetical protein
VATGGVAAALAAFALPDGLAEDERALVEGAAALLGEVGA